MPKKGQRYKLDKKNKTLILNLIAHGIEKRGELAQFIGVNRNTLTKWFDEGLITPEEINQARLSTKVKAQTVLMRVMEAGNSPAVLNKIKAGDAVNASKFYLERKHPEEYAQKIEQRVYIEVVQRVSAQLIEVIKHEFPDPSDRKRIADRLRTIYNI